LESDGPLALILPAALTGLLLSSLLTGLLMTALSGLLTGLLLSAAALLTALSRLLARIRVPAAALLPALTALLATTLILLAGTLFIRVHDHSLRSLPTRRQQMRRRLGSRCAAGMTVGHRTNDNGGAEPCARESRLARLSRRCSMAVGTVGDAEAVVLKRRIAAGTWPAGRAAIERWQRWRRVGAVWRGVGTVLRFLLGARIGGLRRERAHRDCSSRQRDNGFGGPRPAIMMAVG